MARRPPKPDTEDSRWELRVAHTRRDGVVVSVWRHCAARRGRAHGGGAAPIATLRGRPYRLIESLLLKRLSHLGLAAAGITKGRSIAGRVHERDAVSLALLFRALAPMRSIDRIRLVADGIDRLSPEEANYWLGMALHRTRPRRVLAALRMLLTTP